MERRQALDLALSKMGLEAGDAFDPDTAARLKQYIYSAGGRRTGEEAYLAFRGQLPKVDGLIKERGLVAG